MIDIKVKNLSFIYPGRGKEVLKDITLDIYQGETLVIIGKSGSGKSTLLKLLSHILIPTKGNVTIRPTLKEAMVFQDPRLLPWKTVAENIRLAVRDHKKEEQEAIIQSSLELVGLKDVAHEYPRTLSGGMAQRVGLARALAIQPDILWMDEPFSALDAITRSKLQKDFASIRNQCSFTTVFITHDIYEAVQLANRIVILDEGKIKNIHNITSEDTSIVSTEERIKLAQKVLDQFAGA